MPGSSGSPPRCGCCRRTRTCASRSSRRSRTSHAIRRATTAVSSMRGCTTRPARSRRASAAKASVTSRRTATSMPSRSSGPASWSSPSTSRSCPRWPPSASERPPTRSPGSRRSGPSGSAEIEPHAAGIRALWSPSTGIVDYRAVARAYADDIRARGATIDTSRAVTAIDRSGDELIVRTTQGDLVARRLIVCAGLQSDRVAVMTGDATPDRPRIVPFRGDYYTLVPEARSLVRGLIYPVPDPRFPFLGVHLTKRIDGAVLAGPNAVLATAREGYRRTDVSVRDLADSVAYPGFLRLGLRYWRTGLAEMWRDLSKRSFLAEPPALRPGASVGAPSIRSVGGARPGPGARRVARRRLHARGQRPRAARRERALAGRDVVARDRPGARRGGGDPVRAVRRAGPSARDVGHRYQREAGRSCWSWRRPCVVRCRHPGRQPAMPVRT